MRTNHIGTPDSVEDSERSDYPPKDPFPCPGLRPYCANRMNGSFIEWHFRQTELGDRTELTVWGGRKKTQNIGVTSVQPRTQVHSIPLAFSTNTCIHNDLKFTLNTQTDTDISRGPSVSTD